MNAFFSSHVQKTRAKNARENVGEIDPWSSGEKKLEVTKTSTSTSATTSEIMTSGVKMKYAIGHPYMTSCNFLSLMTPPSPSSHPLILCPQFCRHKILETPFMVMT